MIRIPAWMKFSACLLSACVILARPAAGSTKIDLDGDWQFRVDPQAQGQMGAWWKALPGELGLFDQDRQPRPWYRVWQDEASPVRLRMDWKHDAQYPYGPVGFRAQVERRAAEELPSYGLRDDRAVWEVRDSDDRVVAKGEKEMGEIGPPAQLAADFAKASTKSWTLRIRVYRPTGSRARERQITWVDPRSGGEDAAEMKRKGTFPANPAILETTPPEKRPW